MQIIADLHTHTLSATHAFNTLDEMAAKAAALGYAALAITDHGPAMPDAPHMWHFANQTALPLVLHGVAMMYGAEANPQPLHPRSADRKRSHPPVAGCGRKPLCGLHRPFRAAELPL